MHASLRCRITSSWRDTDDIRRTADDSFSRASSNSTFSDIFAARGPIAHIALTSSPSSLHLVQTAARM
jgi:hypothetical protein